LHGGYCCSKSKPNKNEQKENPSQRFSPLKRANPFNKGKNTEEGFKKISNEKES
jgi:hypothetical protein